jgi:rod shape-determining protein MreD
MNTRRQGVTSFGAAGFVPLLSTLLLSMLMLLPLGSGLATYAMPHLALISVFYWLSSRPLLLPYGACALIGLFLDLWMGVPLGMNMILLLLTRLFVLSQLKHYKGRNRGVHWVVFSVLSLGLYILFWGIISVVSGALLSIESLVFQWLVTSFFYAPVAFVLGRLRRWVL